MTIIIKDKSGKEFAVRAKGEVTITRTTNLMECECQRWEMVEFEDTDENPWF